MDFKKIPLLKTLSYEELEYFKKLALIKKYKKGDVIFSTGDCPKKMYIIYSGFIKIFLDLSDGREQILYIYKKNEFVGGLNILNQDNYLYKSQSLRDSTIIEVDRSVFNILFLNNKEALKVILDQSYRRIRKSEELVYRLNEINADLK
ncbi:MAG: Crp/Fnr family transcriptional regulator, partial [Anaerococcus sp.]